MTKEDQIRVLRDLAYATDGKLRKRLLIKHWDFCEIGKTRELTKEVVSRMRRERLVELIEEAEGLAPHLETT